jgi:hypothetical protein
LITESPSKLKDIKINNANQKEMKIESYSRLPKIKNKFKKQTMRNY